METSDRHIALDVIDGWWVSTVRLVGGLSYGGWEYETMVFPHDGEDVSSWIEEFCDRYRTEVDAVVGHANVIAQLREGVSVRDLERT